MDLALILLIGAGVTALLAFVFCFFGYRWARFLLPICGLIVLEGLIYVFVYGRFALNELGVWLFFGGSSIAIYIILFFLKRIAGFFTGLLASAFFLLFIVYAFNIQNLIFLLPICLTLCIITGILTIVYQKNAVIVSTSLFGACIVSWLGLYVVFEVFIGKTPLALDNLSSALMGYLSANALLVAASAAGLAILSALIQIFSTGNKQALAGLAKEDTSFHFEKKSKPEKKQQLTEDEQSEAKPAAQIKKKSFALEKKQKTKKEDAEKSKKKSFRLQR